MSEGDLLAASLSLKLAAISTGCLLLLCTPLAWWLARSQSHSARLLESFSLLPLVLPPSVLGFYLLILLQPQGPLSLLGLQKLAFSFEGLVMGSIIYSLPFALLPLRQAMRSIPAAQLDSAACLGAGPWAQFRHIVLPQCKSSFVVAAALCFAHTLGEFGVVLMIGGSIPGETRVLSIALYEHVEALDFASAHKLAALLAIGSWLLSLPIFLRRSS